MATRAERFRSEEQRQSKQTPRGAHSPRPPSGAREQARTGKNATHAFEAHAPNERASRKSTRGGANRAKPDSTFNHTEEMKSSSSKNRYRKARARRIRVRGRP